MRHTFFAGTLTLLFPEVALTTLVTLSTPLCALVLPTRPAHGLAPGRLRARVRAVAIAPVTGPAERKHSFATRTSMLDQALHGPTPARNWTANAPRATCRAANGLPLRGPRAAGLTSRAALFLAGPGPFATLSSRAHPRNRTGSGLPSQARSCRSPAPLTIGFPRFSTIVHSAAPRTAPQPRLWGRIAAHLNRPVGLRSPTRPMSCSCEDPDRPSDPGYLPSTGWTVARSR
jgi:hypothetical protein